MRRLARNQSPPEVRLQAEEQQPGNPRDQRQERHEHRELAEDVLPARERPREVERHRVVAQVDRDQLRADQRGEDRAEAGLDDQEAQEEGAVDRQQLVDRGLQHLEAQRVVVQVDEHCAHQGRAEAEHEVEAEGARGEQLAEGVAGEHQEAEVPRRGRAVGSLVPTPIDGHWRPPWLAGKSPASEFALGGLLKNGVFLNHCFI